MGRAEERQKMPRSRGGNDGLVSDLAITGALSLGLKFTEQGPTSSCFASLKQALASHFMGYLPALLDQILAGPWGMVVTLKLL